MSTSESLIHTHRFPAWVRDSDLHTFLGAFHICAAAGRPQPAQPYRVWLIASHVRFHSALCQDLLTPGCDHGLLCADRVHASCCQPGMYSSCSGYAAMFWALNVGDLFAVFRLSGSSLISLGFDASETLFVTILVFSEAMIGLILVAMLIAYLPTMYSAFSRREQVVNMLEVRAGSPPSALEMLLRFHRNQGLEKLADYWKVWEDWFADIEESHTTLPP